MAAFLCDARGSQSLLNGIRSTIHWQLHGCMSTIDGYPWGVMDVADNDYVRTKLFFPDYVCPSGLDMCMIGFLRNMMDR